jgi:hypothetical protein
MVENPHFFGSSTMNTKPPFDLFALFGRFARDQKLSLRDPQSLECFLASARAALRSAVTMDTLLQGQRTENMFAALAVSLGHYKLLNREDNGDTHPAGRYQAPDFRVVLNDGDRWLIEVKNLYDAEAGRQLFTAKEDYLARLQGYADAMQCPLMFAIYWAKWRAWTLVSPNDFDLHNGKRGITMFDAMRANRMAALGDRMIATTPPLRLRFNVDTSKPRDVEADGKVQFTIAGASLYCREKEIVDPVEQKIAWMFMELGEWESGEPTAHVTEGQLDAIEFEWTPIERSNADQPFETIGTLSRMFSRYYASQTVIEQQIIQTEAELVPDWFAPLVASGPKGTNLPLWRFILQPNKAKGAGKP